MPVARAPCVSTSRPPVAGQMCSSSSCLWTPIELPGRTGGVGLFCSVLSCPVMIAYDNIRRACSLSACRHSTGSTVKINMRVAAKSGRSNDQIEGLPSNQLTSIGRKTHQKQSGHSLSLPTGTCCLSFARLIAHIRRLSGRLIATLLANYLAD